ncbi:MAG: RHS repeat-associated core domain-containing protein, partial [Anaerolineae bacterium]|nr:RHS repeat-associated core domain-containing protein [Anaerolineae bacterium]
LDLQPGLSVTLSEATGAAVTRYVHAPRGIHAQKDSSGNWDWMMQDGLGSVRAVADNDAGVLWNGSTAPYGDYFGEVGTRQSNYGFTGEYTDPITGQVHLRVRDYNPALGVFGSLDPFEGMAGRPMSLNGYAWVEGNPSNLVDLSGAEPIPVETCSRSRSSLSDDEVARCNYGAWLLGFYPESGSLEYWLRFTGDSLRELFWKRNDGIDYAFVPCNFVALGNKEIGAVNVLRRMEEYLGHPLEFSEILAMIWRSEVSTIYDVPPSQLLQQQLDHNMTLSAAGNSMEQFQRNLRTAIYRQFHGECKREGVRSGICGADRLIRDLLSGIQGWYDADGYFNGWENYLEIAKFQQSSPPPGGGEGGGQCGQGYTWGNLPSTEIPLDPPVIGKSHIIDWIYFKSGNYKYFVIQEPSFCASTARLYPSNLSGICL